jgi:hypothetical protein
MSGSGHQRKCSERSNDFRSATLTGHELARLAGTLSAKGTPVTLARQPIARPL